MAQKAVRLTDCNVHCTCRIYSTNAQDTGISVWSTLHYINCASVVGLSVCSVRLMTGNDNCPMCVFVFAFLLLAMSHNKDAIAADHYMVMGEKEREGRGTD